MLNFADSQVVVVTLDVSRSGLVVVARFCFALDQYLAKYHTSSWLDLLRQTAGHNIINNCDCYEETNEVIDTQCV